ncbi:MAG TPA: biopolymer transporter ExbD, partial [Vicinamibacterales bacterium]|nr:biopolymer transporter ExbD [Vicinamibacterales bacterium]
SNTVDKPTTQDNTVVAVGKDGAMYVNSKQVSEGEMVSKISEALENKKEKVVFINADEEALYSSVMLAMDQLHQAGVEDIALITERRRPPSGGGQ